MAGRWVPARAITRKTKARKAISPFSPLWPKPTNTFGENCAMAIGPMGNRSHAICRVSSRPCPKASRRSSRGPIPVSIVGRRSKPTKKPRCDSSWWRARPRVCWNDCKPPIGSPRPRLTPTSSANSAINQRAGAENLIKEANNDAGLAAHPSRRWATNCVHFQLVMLAYNLNCWLLLFQREEEVKADQLQHTRLATARLRFLFVAARIWKHSRRVGISYSDQYAERGLFQRLMKRLREIATGPAGFSPVLATPLSG